MQQRIILQKILIILIALTPISCKHLSKAENLTNLLASTSVNVAGNIDNQTVKKDIDFTNADFEGTLSVPVELFTESGRARMKDAFENLGTNLKTTAYGASNTVKNAVNATTGVITGGNKGASIVDSFKARQTEQVVALKMGANSNNRQTINNLGSKEQNASDIQKAVRSGDENSRVYYDENAAEAGFHDNSTGDVYINLAKGENSNVTNATNTESLLFVSGHERGHRYSDNEGFADTIGNEAKSAWNAVNWIYGDSIGSNPSVTNNSWANHNGVGNNPISNTNELVQNSILQHNNQIASNVAPENRDNFIPAIPLAYALAGTVLTNEYLKSQGGGDAGVGAHRVANQVKEGVSTAYEGVKNLDPHLRQSLENVEAGVSFVTQKAIDGSDIAVSSIFDTNTNKPVTQVLQEANQWYDNLPESQKGSVDLAMLLSSVAGGSYLKNLEESKSSKDQVTFTVTDHAKKRQIERSVSNEDIKKTIKDGDKFYDPKNDSFVYVYKDSKTGKYNMVAVSKDDKVKTTLNSSKENKVIRPRFQKVEK
jgi:hypothetical protein